MRKPLASLWVVIPGCAFLAARPGLASAQSAEGEPGGPNMHELYRNSSLPKSHADFTRFTYRPPGDRVIEQPDAFRLLFRTRDGQPDGWAERRGDSVLYYDRTGRVTRVQRLPAEFSADE